MICLQKAPQSQECDTTEESGIQLDLVETVYEILKKAVSRTFCKFRQKYKNVATSYRQGKLF